MLRGVDLNLNEFSLTKYTKVGTTESLNLSVEHGSNFWSCISQDVNEDKAMLKLIFNPNMSDRRTEGERFVHPDLNLSYMQRLQRLLADEALVVQQRKDAFFNQDFNIEKPGSMFPSWAAPFEITSGKASDKKNLFVIPYTPESEKILATATPVFDKTTEDGARFRIYRHGSVEVRTCQEHEGEEITGVVLSALPALQDAEHKEVDDDEKIVKATEYVERVQGDAAKRMYRRSYVVLETEQGNLIMTEKLENGTVTWEENADDLDERNAHAKVVRTSSCSAEVLVKDMKMYKARETNCYGSQASLSKCKRYAQIAFSRARGETSTTSGFWKQAAETSKNLAQVKMTPLTAQASAAAAPEKRSFDQLREELGLSDELMAKFMQIKGLA